MRIVSRPPDGTSGVCPTCGAIAVIDPFAGTGDAPCPVCGVLLWFLLTTEGVQFQTWDEVPPDLHERLREFLSRHADSLLGADSLDRVELALDIEDQFGVTIPDEELRKMRSIGDIIDYLFCRLRHGE
jgi:acyl carrier protein